MSNNLVGKTLIGIQISKDKINLKFQTTEGDIIAMCDADCCSHTWVEHIELPAMGFPALVISDEDIDMPDLGDMLGHDCMKYYGYKIITDKGEILIDYRNDSNGYYGGSLEWDGELFYDSVYGQNKSKEDYEDVK